MAFTLLSFEIFTIKIHHKQRESPHGEYFKATLLGMWKTGSKEATGSQKKGTKQVQQPCKDIFKNVEVNHILDPSFNFYISVLLIPLNSWSPRLHET